MREERLDELWGLTEGVGGRGAGGGRWTGKGSWMSGGAGFSRGMEVIGSSNVGEMEVLEELWLVDGW